MLFEGQYFDGHSPRSQTARLRPVGEHFVLQLEDGECQLTGEDIELREPIGKTPRQLLLPDGASLNLPWHPNLDRQLREHGFSRGLGVQWFESRWWAALGSLAAIVVLVLLTVQYGLPRMAKSLAQNIPSTALNDYSRKALNYMDEEFFLDSEIPLPQQVELHQGFLALKQQFPELSGSQLWLRQSPIIGANALAFPDGTIILTDELYALAEHPDELLAILAHELGHVHHRHSMQQIIQASGLGLMMAVLFGDASSLGSVMSGLPTWALQSNYSRIAELEADEFARQWLLAEDKDLHLFTRIMSRLDDSDRETGYFDSHPATRERIEHFLREE